MIHIRRKVSGNFRNQLELLKIDKNKIYFINISAADFFTLNPFISLWLYGRIDPNLKCVGYFCCCFVFVFCV